MPTSAFPRVRISGSGHSVRERLENLPVQIVGEADPADLAVLLGGAGEVESVHAAKALDAAGHQIGNPGWTLGLPALTSTQPDAIARASRVTVPAAFVVGAIVLLRPLMEAGALPAGDLVVSVTGEKPDDAAAAAVMRHALLPAPPHFKAVAQSAEQIVVEVTVGVHGKTPALTIGRAHDIFASHYKYATHLRMLPPEASQSSSAPGVGTEAGSDADNITLQVRSGDTAAGGLTLTAWLDRDRTSAILQVVTLMLGLETADESPLLEESRDA